MCILSIRYLGVPRYLGVNPLYFAAGCFLEYETSYVGNDVPSKQVDWKSEWERLNKRNKTAIECLKLCRAVQACLFWTYNENGRKCNLKTHNNQSEYVVTAFSGSKLCTGMAMQFFLQIVFRFYLF